MSPRPVPARYPVRFATGALAAAAMGCGAVCEGPGCEELFSEAELAIVDPTGASEVRVPAEAAHVVDGREADGFDWTVAPFDGGAFIGAPASSELLRITPDATTTGPAWWTDPDPGARLGAALVRVGADLWIGAPGADRSAGAVYVVPIAAAAPPARLVLTGATPDDQLGAGVHACADLTGDGAQDVIVAAPLFATPAEGWTLGPIPNLAGALFLVPSGSTGTARPWELAGARVWWGDSDGAGAGAAVSCDQDLDGDGAVDLAVGSPWANGGRGQVHLLSADAESGALGDRSWRILDGTADEWLGRSLAAWDTASGAVLAVGGPTWGPDDAERGLGRVRLFSREALASDVQVTPDPVGTIEGVRGLSGPQHFGRWLGTGDLDGNGQADLIVGAPDLVEVDDDGAELFDAGRIWVWYGWSPPNSPVVLSADAAPFEVRGVRAFQSVGRAVVAADYDADGDDELWVPTRALGPTAAQ